MTRNFLIRRQTFFSVPRFVHFLCRRVLSTLALSYLRESFYLGWVLQSFSVFINFPRWVWCSSPWQYLSEDHETPSWHRLLISQMFRSISPFSMQPILWFLIVERMETVNRNKNDRVQSLLNSLNRNLSPNFYNPITPHREYTVFI